MKAGGSVNAIGYVENNFSGYDSYKICTCLFRFLFLFFFFFVLFDPSHDVQTCLQAYAYSEGEDQPVHPQGLINGIFLSYLFSVLCCLASFLSFASSLFIYCVFLHVHYA